MREQFVSLLKGTETAEAKRLPQRPISRIGLSRPLRILLPLLALSSSAAGMIQFRAELRPEFVVPLNNGVSPVGLSSASGVGTFVLDLTPGAPQLSYELSFENLSLTNDITGIHFHFGHSPDSATFTQLNLSQQKSFIANHESADGPNGPHLLNVFGLPREDDAQLFINTMENRLSGVWDNSDENFGPDGTRDPGDSIALKDAIDLILAGEVYVQVHTRAFPAPNTGELRGQLTQVPEPSIALLLMASSIYFLSRRRVLH